MLNFRLLKIVIIEIIYFALVWLMGRRIGQMLKWAQGNIYDVRPLGKILKTPNHFCFLSWSLKIQNNLGYFTGHGQVWSWWEASHALRGREESDVKSRGKYCYLSGKRGKIQAWPANLTQFKELEICGNLPQCRSKHFYM